MTRVRTLTSEQRARKNVGNAAYMRARYADTPRVLTDREKTAKRRRDAIRSQWRTVARRFARLVADLEQRPVPLAERARRAGL